jgi:hypothetical protein
VTARSKRVALAAVLATGALVLVNPAPATRAPRAPRRPARTPSEGRQPRVSSGRVRLAASRFLDGYLPYLHGHGAARSIADATPSLRSRLTARPLVIPPAVRALTPSVLSLTPAAGLAFTATVTEGELPRYRLVLRLVDINGRLLVTSVEGAR